ncbi:MAG: OpgC domain-containing protein [Candidatus Dojkabacteria bacterium]|jgi:hypothetical protein|nr:OpgC domain-containing protein [Candidatus Dojkabacteria bacterium]
MKERDLSIDFLRATAILLMTITHVNTLLYLGKNPILDIFTTAGVTLCFSIFLFSSAYLNGLKIQKDIKFKLKDTLNRVLEIYMVYVILGIFITFILDSGISFSKITDIVLLRNIPTFTEFLIAFIIFSFVPLIFSKQIKYLISKPFWLILITILIYILGSIVYTEISKYTYTDSIRILLENIFGYKSVHIFPLTYYLPIYSLGILISKYNSGKILTMVLISSITLFAVLLSFNLSHWYRWPPSPLFLLYTFIYIPVIILIYRRFINFLSKGIFKLFTNIGKYPLDQFFLSTLFVFLAVYFFKASINPLLSILVNLGIFSLLLLHPIVFRRKMV